MLHLLGIKNCNKIRDTKKWLEEKGAEYTFVDLKKEPLTRHELEDLKEKVGLDVLVNKRGMTWRRNGYADMDLSEDELFEKLLEKQTMIKRPVLVDGHAVMVGYDEESFEAFVSTEEEDKSGKDE